MINHKNDQKDALLTEARLLWVKPPQKYIEIVMEEFFIILKQNNLKMKKLQVGENFIFYSKTKCINFLNGMIDLIRNPLVIYQGVRIKKDGKQIEIFGEIEKLYEYMKKFCYQSDFEAIYKFCVIFSEKGKIKVGRVRHKITDEEKIAKVYEGQTNESDVIIKELSILRLLKQKNLIQLKEVFKSNHQIFLIFDYLEGGNLADLIKKKLSEEEIRIILKNILEGLVFLHDLSIFHRDLKPENILFSKKNQIDTLQIIDFTLADFWNPEHKYLFRRCGTPGYVAPEVLQDKRYGLNVDVYSLGIIMYEMLTTKNPFIHNQNYEEIVTENYNGNIDFSEIKCSMECMDLLTKCLKGDQHKRITSREALKHPFILGNIKSVDQKNTFRIRSFDKLQKQLSNFSQHKIVHMGSIDSPRYPKKIIRSLHTESPVDSTSDSPGTPNSSRTESKSSHLRSLKTHQWNSFKVSKFKK